MTEWLHLENTCITPFQVQRFYSLHYIKPELSVQFYNFKSPTSKRKKSRNEKLLASLRRQRSSFFRVPICLFLPLLCYLLLTVQGSHLLGSNDWFLSLCTMGFPSSSDSKAFTYHAGDPHLLPGSGRSPGEGNGCPVSLPGQSQAQRRLAGYSPWGRKESDRTERLTHM